MVHIQRSASTDWTGVIAGIAIVTVAAVIANSIIAFVQWRSQSRQLTADRESRERERRLDQEERAEVREQQRQDQLVEAAVEIRRLVQITGTTTSFLKPEEKDRSIFHQHFIDVRLRGFYADLAKAAAIAVQDAVAGIALLGTDADADKLIASYERLSFLVQALSFGLAQAATGGLEDDEDLEREEFAAATLSYLDQIEEQLPGLKDATTAYIERRRSYAGPR